MPYFRDEAIVLRTHKLGESDRIVTLLTRNHGKVRAVGKGVRRTRSKVGARLEPFMFVDAQLYIGKSLDIVTQVSTIDAFAEPISQDYDLYAIGAAILEAADKLVSEERQPATSQFWLAIGAIRALANRAQDPLLILDSYLLRAATIAGLAPAIDDCALCGEPGLHGWFDVAEGGSVCGDCREPSARPINAETASHLSALLAGNWQATSQTSVSNRRHASGLIGSFIQHHLESGIRSLRFR